MLILYCFLSQLYIHIYSVCVYIYVHDIYAHTAAAPAKSSWLWLLFLPLSHDAKILLCIVIKSPRLFHVNSTSPMWSSIWFLFLSQLYVFPFVYTNHSSTLPCSTLHMIHSDLLIFFCQQFLLGRVHV